MPKPTSSRKNKRKQRYQLQQKFWLNALDAKENALAGWCDELRNQRRFTPVVRDGLMLIHELERGDTELLFRLFPGLYTQIEAAVLEQQELKAINQLSKIEQMIETIKSLPAPAQTESGGGICQLQVKAVTIPEDDDEEISTLKVIAAVVDGNEIANNFMRSLGAIGGGVSEARPSHHDQITMQTNGV